MNLEPARQTSAPTFQKSLRGQLSPFVWAAIFWGVLGSALVWALSPKEQLSVAMAWWACFFLFSLMDLGALAGVVGTLLMGPPEGDRVRWGVRLAFLGCLKVGLLGVGAYLLSGNRGIPSPSLLSGLGTLIVVPLVGGGLWSFMPPSRD